MEHKTFTERIIHLKPGDTVHTLDGRFEIIHYCGNGTWFVKEFKDIYEQSADSDGLYDEWVREEWQRDFTIRDKDLQKYFYELTGHICCFLPEKEETHE